jgi:hypothetical protein
LAIPDDAKYLTLSYIGFESKDVEIGNRKLFNIQLDPDVKTLKEVVVVGYGEQKREDLTGAITSIKTSELKNIPQVSVDQLMQGKASGVVVTNNSGQPGSSASVRIRGIMSLNGNNEPLYVIGGVQGTYALQAVITAVKATQPWNIQAQHNPFYDFKKLKATGTGDQSYTLRFWAKADAAGKKINSLIQNAAYGTVAVPNEKQMTLTAAWAQYTYTFTVSADDMMRPVIHMGLEKGTFFLDNFELGKTEDIISGVNQIPVRNDIVVVPNPTTGLFEIKSTERFESVNIFDISGRLISKFTGNDANQYNVSDLPKGIYEVVAKSKSALSVSKLVKM